MNGSWHRYRPGERWRRPEARARLVIEVPGAVAVCFDAPVVELFEQRAEGLHPAISALGPDLLDPAFGDAAADEVLRRLRDPARAAMTISEALLDQRALAGIGNIWRNEALFVERTDPFATVASLDDDRLRRLVVTARRLLTQSASLAPGRQPMRVYRRSGRPCPRCGTLIRSAPLATEIPRTTYWCPRCQVRPAMTAIEVDCRPSTDGWTCDVGVADDESQSQHTVRVKTGDLARLDPTATEPTELVRRSFDFLLRHEPKESILASFDLPVISRYFPDYETEISRRV